MQTQYEKLTDPQWNIVRKFLPIDRKRYYDLRHIVDALFWYLRVGSQWRNLPDSFPPWQSVYYYFRKWQANGVLVRLNTELNKRERLRLGKPATPSLLSIDSQSIKVAPFIEQATGVDGNKKINGRKRHILTDTLGLVWSVIVHAANQTDGAMAEKVVEPLQGYLHGMKKILADAAYKQRFMDWVYTNLLGVELEISSAPPTNEGFVPVRWRWVTERSFGCFNFFRRLDKDREKTTKSAEAWVYWQNCQIILNRLA
jgi:transposase